MDQGLFKKHIFQIQKIKDSKDEICRLLQEKTGVTVEYEEINLSKKIIKLQVSSVKRNKLLTKKAQEILKERGYTLTF